MEAMEEKAVKMGNGSRERDSGKGATLEAVVVMEKVSRSQEGADGREDQGGERASGPCLQAAHHGQSRCL